MTPESMLAVYQGRAGNRPRPEGFQDVWDAFHASNEDALKFQVATGWQFWADIAEFQPPVDKTYPYATLAYRLDTGWRLDNHAKANHATAEKIDHIEARIGYVVFVPGQSKDVLQRLKNNFGSGDPGIAVMTDMESGKDFAGPGNHSAEANDFHDSLVEWTNGDANRLLGYANAGDWANLWRTRPRGMKRILADYESTIKSGYWAQQYVGGGNTPVPSGFPTACRPFGSWVDMNAKKTTVPALLDDLGLDWLSMATEAQVKALLEDNNKAIVDALNKKFVTHEKTIVSTINHHVDSVLGRITHDGDGEHPDALVHINAGIKAIAKKVGAVTPKVSE